VAAETEAPPAPAEAPAEAPAPASSAAGGATEQATTTGAGSAADVAVTSETAGKSTAGGQSKTGGKTKGAGKSETGAKKGKKNKKGAEDAAASLDGAMSLAAHPRAAQRVAEAKAWGGLIGFILGGYFSLSTYTPVDAGLRAIAAGIFCYLAVWAAAVFAWRRIVVAELRQAEQDLVATSAAARAAAEKPALPAGAGAAS